MKDKLLILGIDTTTRYALEYAKSIGVYTIITDFSTPEKQPLKLLADEYWMVDVSDLDSLEKRCRAEHVTGVYAGNHEFCLDHTMALAERLGLPFYASDEGWACARDKGLFKERCINAGLDVPKRYDIHKPFTPEMLEKVNWPVIIKPVDSSASRGISVCHSKDEIEKAYDFSMQFSNSGNVIVEDYIDAEEAIAFFYFENGKVNLTHVNFDIMSLEGGNPTNSGGIVAKSKTYTKLFQEQLGEKFQKLFSSMNCQHGTAFIQGKLVDGKFYVFEMGYRLDGLCDWTVTKPLYGFSALECMINFALGRKSEYNGETLLKTDSDRVGVFYLPWGNPGQVKKVTSDEVRAMDGVNITLERFKKDDEIRPTGNMLQTAYVMTVIAENKAELIEKIKEINSKLLLLDENGHNLLVPFERFNDLYEAL